MNNKPNKSLQKQFISKMLTLLIFILFVSGAIQGYILKNKLNKDINQEASMIGRSLEQGISETDLASQNIEHQIDLKLTLYDMRIGERLQGRKLTDISTNDLIKLRDEFGLAGITLIAKQGDDLVNVKSTDPKDVGFKWKKIKIAYDDLSAIYRDSIPKDTLSYAAKGMYTLYTSQSGAHTEKPEFFKYSFYHQPNMDYIISAYIQASEVYNFTKRVGPDSWIHEVLKENPYAKEIAVLDPRVFADPTLEKKLYPPLKQVVNGEYTLRSDKDAATLKDMVNHPSERTYIDRINGQTLYKMILPMDKGRVIYISLDYNELSAPLYHYSIILIVFGFISLIALFILTAKFFNKIYRNIQQISNQIKELEAGNLTAKSKVSGGGELGELSDTTNKMVDALHQLITVTQDKATKTQRLSILLEAEANESVEKAFTMSMEETAKARESIEEIDYFLDLVEEHLGLQRDNPMAKEILDKLDTMRDLARKLTNSTTEITITLSDLLKSLHDNSSELSDLSNSLLQQLEKFKLSN